MPTNEPTLMGTCSLCGKSFRRVAMTRHLKTCSLQVKQLPGQSFHLFVESRYDKSYWMHLAVPVDAPLKRLDAFLRKIWLECCGHLSAFNIEGERYYSEVMDDLGGSGMGARLSRVLEPGVAFTYEYDFGSTTELKLKMLAVRDCGTHRSAVELLARNNQPPVSCDHCGSQTATIICTECAWKDRGWLCESCAAAHECGSDMWLPVVNSPRVGVCGYTG